jgi:phage terminase small subunit
MATATKLTPREERFVEEYLIDLNATAAYRRVYPKASYHTARVNAAKLLAKTSIRGRIRAWQRRMRRQTGVNGERVIRELARIAFSDIGDVLDFSRPGRVTIRSVIPADARRALASVKVKRLPATAGQPAAELVEFKLHNKLAALEKLGRHLGLFEALPPLEVLLSALPADAAAAVRKALASVVRPEQVPSGVDDRPAIRVGGDARPESILSPSDEPWLAGRGLASRGPAAGEIGGDAHP